MNKYLKGFLNSIIQLAIGFVGGLFSVNALAVGFIYLPDITIRTDQILMGHFGLRVTGGVIDGVLSFVVGSLPLCFILAMLTTSTLLAFFTIKLIKKIDIEKIIGAIQADFNKGKAK